MRALQGVQKFSIDTFRRLITSLVIVTTMITFEGFMLSQMALIMFIMFSQRIRLMRSCAGAPEERSRRLPARLAVRGLGLQDLAGPG